MEWLRLDQSLFYESALGRAYCADALEVMRSIPSETVNLVLTSPPFALRREKPYRNVPAAEYVAWFRPFADEVFRVLTADGSFVFDIGGTWTRGEPTRSLYHFELLLNLCSDKGPFKLAQEFYWYNPAKMPAPAEWVTVRRIRAKDAVHPIWWLSKTAYPKASNTRVLTPYKGDMKALLRHGYNEGPRPSGHVVSDKWAEDHGGAIPANLIIAANTRSSGPYLEACRQRGLSVHPARFVEAIPKFFINFLTTEGDVVLDPFAGSNMTGYVAEKHGRRWISIDIVEEYVVTSAFRFPLAKLSPEASRCLERLTLGRVVEP
jgi:DNA modification methylase